MKKLNFDTGIEAYKLGSGVLRFNPADPNVYIRFRDAAESMAQLEQDMAQAAAGENADLLDILRRTDKAIKQNLNQVFGPGNDFDALVDGVNLLSAASDGRTVAVHLFEALEPVLLAGAKRCAQAQAAAMQ